jgi:hypothetical protein
MEDELYKKIGRQEMMIEALKKQSAELSSLIAKFIAGEETAEEWSISPQGQLVRNPTEPTAKRTQK